MKKKRIHYIKNATTYIPPAFFFFFFDEKEDRVKRKLNVCFINE